MKKRISMLLALVFALSAFFLPGTAGVDASGDNQIVIGLEAEPVTLDIAQMSDYNTLRAIIEMYDQLVEFAEDSMEVVPALATSWDVSEDGLEYTFYLRDDVKFHDGTPFNAAAARYNIERQIDPEHEAYGTAPAGYVYAETTFGMIDSVEDIDEYTLLIKLSVPFAPFLSNMAMHASSMVSPTALQTYGTDITSNPVGTGPYKFVSYTPGVELILEKNEDYYKGAPNIDRLIFRPIKDANVRLNELEAGAVDLIVTIPPDNLEALKANDNFKVLEQPSMHVWYLIPNVNVEPFGDPLVRQALMYGINRQAIVDHILLGTSVLAHNLLPPTIVGYEDNVTKYEYNPEKAMELLAEAGYPDGFSAEFLIPESGSGMQQPEAMGLAIQSDLAAIGINLDIVKMEWGAYLDETMKAAEESTVEIFQMSWLGDNGDPDNFLYVLTGGSQCPPIGFNMGFYKNEEYDAILEEARTTLDHDKRMELYAEAQIILMNEVPVIPIDHESQIVATSNRLENFKLHPSGEFRFEDAYVN